MHNGGQVDLAWQCSFTTVPRMDTRSKDADSTNLINGMDFDTVRLDWNNIRTIADRLRPYSLFWL